MWSSIADYRPPPLEVLRNPWIQWTVVLPRDITGPRYEGIHRWGPAALKALGVTDALTHMEWFARPDGSVAVSEVAARPPGAQLTSMHGYAHDFDLYRAWAELVILGRFDVPERRFAAGTAYLRGMGRGRVRAVHGIEARPAADRAPGRGGAAAAAGAARGQSTTWARGTSIVRDPDTAVVEDALQPDRRRRPRRAGRGLTGVRMNIVMLSPGYPAEMAYFTRALAGVGARVIGVGDQPPHALPEAARESLAHYEHVNSPTRARCSRRCAGCPGTPRSTRWSASGSRT